MKTPTTYLYSIFLTTVIAGFSLQSMQVSAQECLTPVYHPGFDYACDCSETPAACLPTKEVHKQGYTTCMNGDDYYECPNSHETVGTENNCIRSINVGGYVQCLVWMGTVVPEVVSVTLDAIVSLIGVGGTSGPCTFCNMTDCKPSLQNSNIDRDIVPIDAEEVDFIPCSG